MKTLYVSGEESGAQVALRARRLGLDGRRLRVLAEIQPSASRHAGGRSAGGVRDRLDPDRSIPSSSARRPVLVAQVRECAAHLAHGQGQRNDGDPGRPRHEGRPAAGPRVLEHIVDTVLYFEGDTHSSFRPARHQEPLRRRQRDRRLRDDRARPEGRGNLSAIFLVASSRCRRLRAGHALRRRRGRCWWRCRRWSIPAGPARGGCRWPGARPAGDAAGVLHRHAGIATIDQDVFVNAVGGVRISEPAADLA